MMKKTFCALALAAATLTAQAGTLTVQTFNPTATGNIVGDLTAKGFVLRNDSNPLGTSSFYQGDLFPGQGGTGGYLGANYTAAAEGGQIDELLITPLFSTYMGGYISLFLRADAAPGFFDTVQFGFSSGTGTGANAASSSTAAFAFGSPIVVPTDNWTQYVFNFAATGAASSNSRFAIRYVGPADRSNAIGIDTLAVSVPEPTTTMMLGLGFAGLIAARRRKAK